MGVFCHKYFLLVILCCLNFDDVFSGQISYSLSMDVIAYLKTETSYTPWSTALNNLAYIDKLFSRTGTYGSLKVHGKVFQSIILKNWILKHIHITATDVIKLKYLLSIYLI